MPLLASTLVDFGQVFLDPATWNVTLRSLLVSVIATLIAMDLALIFAGLLLEAKGRAARFFDALFSAFVAIPAVVVGLLALMFFTSPRLKLQSRQSQESVKGSALRVSPQLLTNET